MIVCGSLPKNENAWTTFHMVCFIHWYKICTYLWSVRFPHNTVQVPSSIFIKGEYSNLWVAAGQRELGECDLTALTRYKACRGWGNRGEYPYEFTKFSSTFHCFKNFNSLFNLHNLKIIFTLWYEFTWNLQLFDIFIATLNSNFYIFMNNVVYWIHERNIFHWGLLNISLSFTYIIIELLCFNVTIKYGAIYIKVKKKIFNFIFLFRPFSRNNLVNLIFQ